MVATDMPSVSQSTPQDAVPALDAVFGRSQAIRIVRKKMDRLTGISTRVMIHGESGTGEEVIAKALHQTSA